MKRIWRSGGICASIPTTGWWPMSWRRSGMPSCAPWRRRVRRPNSNTTRTKPVSARWSGRRSWNSPRRLPASGATRGPRRASGSASHGSSLEDAASGPEHLRPRVAPVLDAIGRKTIWVGEAGEGTRLKLVTNSWVLAAVEATAETVALAEGLGIDPSLLFEAVEGGPLDMGYLRMKGAAMTQGGSRRRSGSAWPRRTPGWSRNRPPAAASTCPWWRRSGAGWSRRCPSTATRTSARRTPPRRPRPEPRRAAGPQGLVV